MAGRMGPRDGLGQKSTFKPISLPPPNAHFFFLTMASPEEHCSLSTVLVAAAALPARFSSFSRSVAAGNYISIDLREPSHHLKGITYHIADLTSADMMRQVFDEVRPDIVIHTASPKFDSPNQIMYKVNVEGTKNLVQIAKESGIPILCVYKLRERHQRRQN